jgi:hypothetical protein
VRRPARALTPGVIVITLGILGAGPAAAEFQYKQGSFFKTDDTVVPVNDQITGVGFKPKAVIFFYTRQLATGVATDISAGWGFATGPANAKAIGIAALDNIPTLQNRRSGKGQSIGHCIVLVTSGGVQNVVAAAAFVQFDPDGFTIQWTVNEARRDLIHYIALGGSDITEALVDDFLVTAGTGIQAEAVGFQPDFAMFLAIRSGLVGPTATTEAHHSIGFATAAAQVVTGGQIEDIGAIGTRRSCAWQPPGSVLALENDTCTPGGAGDTRFTVAFTPTGFDVNKVLNALNGQYVFYLALKGGRYGVGAFNKDNATAAPPDLDQPVTGVGFRPLGLMLASDDLPASANVQSHARISTGASDLATHAATWYHSVDNVNPTDSNMRTSTNQIAVHASGAAGATVDAAGFLKSFDPDGFTLTWSANNTGAGANHQILYAAFGPSTSYRSIGSALDYTVGAVSATLGSRTLTGTGGTAWKGANRLRGDRITIPCPDPPACSGGTHYTIFAVASNTQLTLTEPFGGATNSYSYLIARQFPTLQAWEDCIDGPPVDVAPCTVFAPASTSLVNDRRSEVGVASRDGVLAGGLVIDGNVAANTDAAHTITLTADFGNAHRGIAWDGVGSPPHVVIGNGLNTNPAIQIQDDFVTVERLEIKGGSGMNAHGLEISGIAAANDLVVRHNLIHNVTGDGIVVGDSSVIMDLYNNVIYSGSRRGIHIPPIQLDVGSQLRVLNNTIFSNVNQAVLAPGGGTGYGTLTLQNNISHSNFGGFGIAGAPGSINGASSNNLSGDGSATTHSPAGGGVDNVDNGNGTINFVATTSGSEDLHITAGSAAQNAGANLSAIFSADVDGGPRAVPWDIGADDISVTTAVELLSFQAQGLGSGVELVWETASELDNLGFHLYRSTSADGPYERITSSVIPGLGSSPLGQRYRWLDTAVEGGGRYYYQLEDIETTGRTKRHGPVSSEPGAYEGGGSTGEDGRTSSGGTLHGDPGVPTLRVVERGRDHVVLELVTPGFRAVPLSAGGVRLEVPGFEEVDDPGTPAVPVRGVLVDAIAGRRVRMASVVPQELLSVCGLEVVPSAARTAVVSAAGMVRAGRAPRRPGEAYGRGGYYPRQWARLAGVAFQGETKKAQLVLSPLRHDPRARATRLARRLLVRVEFVGVARGERSLGGSQGRSPRPGSVRIRGLVAQLVTKEAGLYRVRFEEVFGSSRRGAPLSQLRLSRKGQAVAYHVEPRGPLFGPGSSLYFVGGGELSPTSDAVYELSVGQGGLQMSLLSASPTGAATLDYDVRRSFETNRLYQAALLEAPDLWLWDLLVSPLSRSRSFTVTGLASSSRPSRVRVWMQGASDFPADPDHHVRLSVNGNLVAEASWDGKREQLIEGDVPPGILVEGANTLTLRNVGDTGASSSLVFLNRYEVRYPRRLQGENGRLEGDFAEGGVAELTGLEGPGFVVDTTGAPTWLCDLQTGSAGLRFRAEGGRRYLAVSETSLLAPEVRRVATGRLRTGSRVDWLLVAPREFLGAAQPLVELRKSQGLRTKVVSIEQVNEEFGHGEAGPEGLKAFLEYAYASWPRPSLRYVVLLGDSTYDPKDYLGMHDPDRVPFFPVKTSYLWTASDPTYGAVNGDDLLPDVAVGRLPARSVEEAHVLVDKLVAFESAGRTPGGRAVLVADDADPAGPFEADADDIAATVLHNREVQKIYLRDLGAGTRAEIRASFDAGAGLMSYVGHGSTAVWASENLFNTLDVALLSAQGQQPLLLTLNCLNGFFHVPSLDSLTEALLKAEGKGAIVAFSPSGLSQDEAAHRYHKDLLAEIESGRHARLGDAVLAAQAAYADSGAFPELLAVYHLFGDPAQRIRP